MNDLAEVSLDDQVLAVLAGEFGWISSFAVAKRLPAHLQDGKEVDRTLHRLAGDGRVAVTKRAGNTDLFRIPPAPGQEPTAAPLPDPAPRVVRYTGPVDEPIPPPRVRAKRPAPQLRLSPAKASIPREIPMTRITQEQVLEQLSKSPQTTAEIAKALKCEPGAAGYHLKALQKDKKAHKPEGRLGPWALVNGKAAAAPVTKPAKRGMELKKGGVEDLDLKLLVLSNHIAAAENDGRTISAYVLGQVRADLERLAVPA